jgi:glycosyltransferase involved in cell wall biosynthesis
MARLAIVIYSLDGAGAERVSVNLASEFVRLGHDVDFLLASREGELFGEVPKTSGIYYAKVSSARGWRAAIREYALQKEPDVLLAMMEGAGVLALQAIASLTGKFPVFVVSHVHFSLHCRHSTRWQERWLMPLAVRWYLPRASGVIGVSEGVSKEICQIAGVDPAKVHTVYNAVLTEAFYRLVAEPVSHPWFSPERNWLTVMNIGRLTDQKDHVTLLKAIQCVSASRPVRLMILGRGEVLEKLRAMAKSLDIERIVEFAGFDPNPYRLLAAADVFALSSAWEGLPTVLVEALAAGTKVVSTDCPSGPREVLAGGRFGELVPVGDYQLLADAISRAEDFDADNELLCQQLEKFTSKRVAMQYLREIGLEP